MSSSVCIAVLLTLTAAWHGALVSPSRYHVREPTFGHLGICWSFSCDQVRAFILYLKTRQPRQLAVATIPKY